MTNAALLKLLVPHVQFGSSVSVDTWKDVEKNGLMATLPFSGVLQFAWYSFCGWEMLEYGTNGVLFVKVATVDFE